MVLIILVRGTTTPETGTRTRRWDSKLNAPHNLEPLAISATSEAMVICAGRSDIRLNLVHPSYFILDGGNGDPEQALANMVTVSTICFYLLRDRASISR